MYRALFVILIATLLSSCRTGGYVPKTTTTTYVQPVPSQQEVIVIEKRETVNPFLYPGYYIYDFDDFRHHHRHHHHRHH